MSDTKIEELYSLKWNSHMSNFLENFIEHQQEQSLVDVTLSCEGQYIQTHKLILASCSTYFDHLFQTHKDEQKMFVVLYGVSMQDLRIILYFMYHGEVKIPHSELDNVVKLARQLGVKGLSGVVLKGEEVTVKKEPKTEEDIIEPTCTESVDQKKMPNIMNTPPNKKARKSPPKSPSPKPPTFKVPAPKPKKESKQQPNGDSKKVPVRPPHAFTLFANDWKGRLVAKHPGDNSRDITHKLSNMWKSLPTDAKKRYYFEAQKQANEFGTRISTPMVRKEPVKRKADVLKEVKKVKEVEKAEETKSDSPDCIPIETIETHVQIDSSDSD